jgi:4-hydroxy-tetrahydrodipicolinate synthase
VVTRLALDCPRIVGIKDSSRDFPRFLSTLHAIKPQRPEFACLIGCEEILFPSLLMGADGGTIASSGVVPEVIMKLYHEFLNGHLDEAKRIQLMLLDLIDAMLSGVNFPEGFRAGMALRGFELGTSRQLLSPKEQLGLEDIRSKIACILADCGYEEAAHACQRQPGPAADSRAGKSIDVDGIVQEVMRQLRPPVAPGSP